MYTEQDYARVAAVKKKRLGLSFLVLALSLAVLVIGLVIRNKPMATFGTAAVACLFYAVLELKALPWVRYDRYLRDIREGLSHETDADFVSMSEAPRLNNGVMFYDFVVRVGGEDEDERLFYHDADKVVPEFEQGQMLHIVSFGNYITELSAI